MLFSRFILFYYYFTLCVNAPPPTPHPTRRLSVRLSLSLYLLRTCVRSGAFTLHVKRTPAGDRYPDVGMVVSVNWIAEQVVPWMRAGQISTPENLKTYMLSVHNVQVTEA